MLWVLLVALVQAVPVAGASVSQETAPEDINLVDERDLSPEDRADWARLPSARELGRVYPSRAAKENISGMATISCRVLTSGSVADCKVVAENPTGWGFGSAAKAMSPNFLMTKKSASGRSTIGSTIRIPIRFSLSAFRVEPIVATHPRLTPGHADIDCRIAENYGLENCFVHRLEPADPVLRQTALNLARRFKLPEGTNRGVRIILPVEFRNAAPEPSSEPAASR